LTGKVWTGVVFGELEGPKGNQGDVLTVTGIWIRFSPGLNTEEKVERHA